ncbi:MAG: phosphate ABC transporter substrate-binding protein [Pseudomonadota bacterium]
MGAVHAEIPVASDLLAYKVESGLSGDLSSIGSDTLANLMRLWRDAFRRFHPNATIQIEATGSAMAPPALTDGTSNFGAMSRKMRAQEIAAFEQHHGYKPTPIAVAIDALAVYVHKDNPLENMTIVDVDAVFSAQRKCGGDKDVISWGGLGLKGDWMNRPIQLYGRNAVSGTYGYFKKRALCKGEFKNSVNQQADSASVVQRVSNSLSAIGYASIGYRTPGVKVLPLARAIGENYIDASSENAVAGKYPLSRFLYVYVNKHPDLPLSALEREFIKMMLSYEGQLLVVEDGHIPLPASVAAKQLSKISAD